MVTDYKVDFEQVDFLRSRLYKKNTLAESSLYVSKIKSKNKILLTDLLPYDLSIKKAKDLRKGLKEYQMLLCSLFETMKEYKNGNLEKFDGIVGENACQIRAVKVALIHLKNQIDHDKRVQQIAEIKNSIENLLDEKKIAFLMQSGISLKDLLKRETLHILLTLDEMFLLQSYLLTEAKIAQPSEELFFLQYNLFSKASSDSCERIITTPSIKKDIVYPKNLKRFGDVTTTFADHLARRTRKLLSKASVNYVNEITSSSKDESLKKMLSENFMTKHLNCFSLPMFWTYKALFSALQKEKIPIIIHVKFLNKKEDKFEVIDEQRLLFEYSDDLKTYSHFSVSENNINKSAFVVQGIAYQKIDEQLNKDKWIENIKSFPLKNIILAGAADHRQYPDLKQCEKIDILNDNEYENYKILAKNEGFSIDNPSTFFIQHVYPSKIAKVFS